MIRHPLLLGVLVIIPLVATLGVAGCGGNDEAGVYYTLSERSSYGPNAVIAFVSFGGNGLRYINTINERGGAVTALTPSDNDNDLLDEGGFHPAYSPDGATLAIASRRGASNDIFLIDATSGDKKRLDQLTTDPGSDIQPAWSGSGDRLAFTTNRDGDNNIYILQLADPANQVPVDQDPADDQWPSFDPTRNRLAFQSDRSGNTDIWIANLSNGTVRQLTTASSRDEHPAWSPDGNSILFTSNRAGDFDIWSIAPDGTNLRQITADGRSDGYPQWKPDGSRICFTRDRQLWTAKPDGTDQKQLTRTY